MEIFFCYNMQLCFICKLVSGVMGFFTTSVTFVHVWEGVGNWSLCLSVTGVYPWGV